MLDFLKVVSAARSNTSKLVELGTRGLGDEASDQRAEAVDQVSFLSPLGLLVMPKVQSTLRALAARVGGPVEAVALALWDKAVAHDPAPENGETRLWAAAWPKVCVRLLDGLIEIRVGAPTGTVKLAPDGTGYMDKSVARVDDTTANGTITFACATAGSGVAITGTYTDAFGVTTPLAGTIAIAGAVTGSGGLTMPITGKITSGSPRVKA